MLSDFKIAGNGMTKYFTNQEARDVAQKHKALIKQLQLVIKAYEEERKVADLIYTKLGFIMKMV